MKEREVVVVSAARLPIGVHGGAYKDTHVTELGTHAVNAALRVGGFTVKEFDQGHNAAFYDGKPVDIGEIVGTVPVYMPADMQAIYTTNIAHNVGLPDVPSYGVQRICGSGFQSIVSGYLSIRAGQHDAVITYGAECMTQAPQVSRAPRVEGDVWAFEEGHGLEDTIRRSVQHDAADTNMAQTAEVIAEENHITRKASDGYALQSYQRVAEAQRNQWNRYGDERGDMLRGVQSVVVTHNGGPKEVWRDEGSDPTMTMETLAAMRPLQGKFFTPGAASQVSDGAGATILMERAYAEDLGIPYDAVIDGYFAATCKPQTMGWAPVPAVERHWKNTGTGVDDFDLFYVNEAFAPQVLSVIRGLGLPMEKTNPNGGAIALGHPITATGQCITVDAIHELKRTGGERALVTACIGGGQAVVIDLKAA